MRQTLIAVAVFLGLATPLVVPGLGSAGRHPGEELDLELCDPRENRFTLEIDNRYFPLPVGQQWVLSGEDEGETLGLRITVLDDTETFSFRRKTVTTRVVEEVEWVDENGDGVLDPEESLIEVSLNYFAQTQDGTVCYFGEDVEIYEDGEVVSTEGSWRADDRGNAPGIYMPEDPRPGMTFQQEVAPGVAEDRATILRTGKVRVPAGRFRDALFVRDFNPLDGSSGIKVYAPNVGLVVDGTLELISY
jgi:hypothetical protein